jgi:hypothetical protein
MRWIIPFVLLPGVALAQPAIPPCPFPGSNDCLGPVANNSIPAYGVGANGIVVQMPANAVLRAIYVQNTTANAVTGGIDIGTTSGGTDVASAVAVAGNALVVIAPSNGYFSATANQLLYITAHTAWNSAVLNIRFIYDP